MTELKWTLFKDKLPDCTSVYGTDFEEVWEMDNLELSWETYSKDYPNYAWAKLPMPEVPKKERKLHLCGPSLKEAPGSLHCKEDDYANLYLEYGFIYWLIQFCPFCGYSPEKEE